MNAINRPIFPLEVLEQIVTEDVIGQRGPVALLSASRGLRHCAFKHLFKRLKIRISDAKATQKLCDIICVPEGNLKASRGLGGPARYIKALEITYEVKKTQVPATDEAPTNHSGEDAEDGAMTRSFHNCFGQETVIDIFTTIVQHSLPRTLLFNALNADESYSWDNLPTRFQSILLSLIRLPSLSDLDIQHLANLPPELLQSSHLARFSQFHCGPPHSNPAANGVDFRALSEDYPPLNRLVTDHSFSFLGMRKLFRDLRALKVINSVSEHIPSSWTLFKYARNTLQDLTIVENSFADLDLLTPSLSVLPNLQKFNYEAHRVGPGSLCLHILLLLFNATAPLSNLHTISIQLEYIRTETEDDALTLVQAPIWRTLDALLSGPHFSALRRFRVKLKFTLPIRPDDQSWPADFFNLNTGSPNRSLMDEDWNRISSAPSFTNNVQGILQASFIGLESSRTVKSFEFGVEERRYVLNGQV